MDLEFNDEVTVLTPVDINPANANENEYVLPNNADTDLLELKSQKAIVPNSVQNVNFTLPPHLMGRDVNNPEVDAAGTGKRIQKPRPGVKVPYRNLTSQIVSQSEIAQELLERSLKKHPYHDPPQGGDSFFAMKLAHRLATRIVPPSSSTTSSNPNIKNEEKSPDKTAMLDEHILPAGYTVNTDKTEIPDHSELLAILEGDKEPDLIPEESEILCEVKSNLEASQEINEKSKNNSVNNLESGASIEIKSVISLNTSLHRKKGLQYPLIRLNPELEKELALKQLMEFSKRKKKSFNGNNAEDIVEQRKPSENNNNFEVRIPKKRGRKRKIDTVTSVELKKRRIIKSKAEKKMHTLDARIQKKSREKLSARAERIVSKEQRNLNSKKLPQNKNMANKFEIYDLVPNETVQNGKDNVSESLQVVKRKVGRPRILKPKDIILVNKNKKIKQEKTLFNGETDIMTKKSKDKPASSRMMREINRLLGDEGAINMLYSIEEKRSPRSEPKKKMMLPSYRRKRKDLLLKTKLVKNAVLRLSSSPPQKSGKISLRHRPSEKTDEKEIQHRKMSTDSRDSHHSTTSPAHSKFVYPAKIVPADASRIIRRHSSSSSYSSRSNSPRRMSIEGDRSQLPPVFTPPLPVDGISHDKSPAEISKTPVSSKTRSSIDSVEPTSVFDKKSPMILEVSERAERLISEKCKELNIQPERTELLKKRIEYKKSITTTNIIKKNISKITPKLHAELNKNVSTNLIEGEKFIKKKRVSSSDMIDKNTALNSCLAETVKHFFNTNRTNTPVATPSTSAILSQSSTLKKIPLLSFPSSSNSAKNIDLEKKSETEDKQRFSARQTAAVHNFKEISLRRYDHLVQIILTPVSTKLKNALNVQVLRELISALNNVKKDDTCRTVLLTSTGSVFCQGVDFFSLIQHTPDKRKQAALELAAAVKDYVKTLATFTKPIIAGVHGAAVGLGVTMLPWFDMVFASDKATFHTPYAKLGQVPEGAATITLPTMLGNTATSELLLASRKLTASEASHFGLVTRILWPDSFQEELIPIIRGIATQSSQSMDATKALLRKNMCTNLEETLLSESHLLVQHWSSAECQANFKQFLEEETLALQKQRETAV
uniref:Uncharacterized protein n=1 Tax=Clastoptera arizonana TaxID=38151 RepID=A0A1B6E1H7_9HEMI